MELILCNNNLSVPYVVTKVNADKSQNYLILTDQKNILSFFKLIDYDNTIIRYFESDVYKINGLIKYKKEIKNLFTSHKIDKVWFYHQAYGGFFNWIIQYANKQNIQIVYHRVLNDQVYNKSCTLKAFCIHLIYKMLFKTDVEILDRGNNCLMPKLSDEFISKNKIKEHKEDPDSQIIEETSKRIIKKLKLNLSTDSVVLLTGSLFDTKQINVDEYNNKMSPLIEYIGNKNVVCKCHPRFIDESEIEKGLIHLPSFIPFEFFIMYFNNFIGYNSTILRIAAEKGKCAISLLNYLQPISEERKNKWYAYFEGTNVQMPNTISDIKKILLNNTSK